VKLFSSLSTFSLALIFAVQACASPRYKCSDFNTAQQVIDAYRAGATYLDGDGNGYACEKTWNVYVLKGKKHKPSKRAKSEKRGVSTSGGSTLSTPASSQGQLTMGNPSQAGTQPNNYLLLKPQYALSYNASKGIPNWVSWQLNQSWLGTVDRQNDFRPDDTLPPNFYHVTPSDYTGTGYDRGHQAPSGDRTAKVTDNSATFLMTNIIPQAPDLNRGPWEKLESYCRDLVNQGKELYIIAGVSGQKGTLAGGNLSIPARNWKVIVVRDRPGLGLNSVTDSTWIIAVDMPNEDGIKETDWTEYRTTVKLIERVTGYNLLSNVPDKVQQVIENRVDGN
jgi:endonuclease G, mitochondrial